MEHYLWPHLEVQLGFGLLLKCLRHCELALVGIAVNGQVQWEVEEKQEGKGRGRRQKVIGTKITSVPFGLKRLALPAGVLVGVHYPGSLPFKPFLSSLLNNSNKACSCTAPDILHQVSLDFHNSPGGLADRQRGSMVEERVSQLCALGQEITTTPKHFLL